MAKQREQVMEQQGIDAVLDVKNKLYNAQSLTMDEWRDLARKLEWALSNTVDALEYIESVNEGM